MIEKILPFVLTVAFLIAGVSGAGSSSVAVIPAASDEILYNQIMTSIGPDRIAQAQAEGFNLNISFACYSGFTSISFELRSAVGTAMYDSNTVNWQLMRDIQLAVIDSGVFEFTPDEIETACNTYYTPDNRSADMDFGSNINLHINETPFGYEAILYLRHNASAVAGYGNPDYSVSYSWEGVTYDSRS